MGFLSGDQMYVFTTDFAVCDSYLLQYISCSSVSTICSSPSMLAGLLIMWDINGRNMHGAWMGRRGLVHCFYWHELSWVTRMLQYTTNINISYGLCEISVSMWYLRKDAIAYLCGNINLQSCWRNFCMVNICWELYVDFSFVFVFSNY